MPPDLFWRVTPRVFTAIMEGRHQAFQRSEEQRIALAWQIEAFARKKRLPGLDKALRQVRQGEKLQPQSPEDMLEVLRSIDDGRGLMDIKFVPYEGGSEG